MKESCHAIPISPEFTKYLSFATPERQYEYVKLPFGYSESPAEFQKRLLRVLGILIRQDEVLVYVDNILIPTETVDENLKILSLFVFIKTTCF